MASKIRTIAAYILISSFYLFFSGCRRADSGQDLSFVQELIRKDVGLRKNLSFTSDETEKLKKQIDNLIRKGISSALFDKALLNFRDRDIFLMFKGFKQYFDATGDDTRIFFYAKHGAYIDPPSFEFWDGLEYFDNLVAREKDFAEYELFEFDPRLSSLPPMLSTPEKERIINANPANWKNYSSLSAFVEGINKQQKPDVESVKLYYRELGDRQVVKNLITTLEYQLRFAEAYEVFSHHREKFDPKSRSDKLVVTRVLYFSRHYEEFVEWYSYDHASANDRNEMMVGSLAKLGQFDEGISILSDLINHASLKLEVLRQPNDVGDEPALFNLLFFFYFRGVYDDFKRAGKVEEIENMFARRYYSFSEKERDQFRTYRYQLNNPEKWM